MMDISGFRRAAEQFVREKARLSFRAAPAPAPAPTPKKATTPPAPAPTPTAAERKAEREADRKRREGEFSQMLAFVRDPSKSPFAHLAPYRAPNVELPNVEPFVAGRGSDAAEWETHVPDPAAMARAILEAGELAHNGGRPRPKPEGMAAQIIAAGARARDVEPELPTDPTALAIIMAGRRRRGEIS